MPQKNQRGGAPGWLRRLSVRLHLRSRSRSSWVRAFRRALGWQLGAWSLLRILCLPVSLPLPCLHALSLSLSLSLSKIKKYIYIKKKKKKGKPERLHYRAECRDQWRGYWVTPALGYTTGNTEEWEDSGCFQVTEGKESHQWTEREPSTSLPSFNSLSFLVSPN